ncbi:MAG: sporulation protein YqfD [Firmicutes bacterium]|nr:sporulation protein YqfD [Bacillota bacterium]
MTTYQVEGFNQLRLLNELNAQGVLCNKIERASNREMFISVPHKHCVKFVAICKELCYTITVLKSVDLKSSLNLFVKRAGLIIGAIVFCTAFVISHLFVWRIEVAGGDYATNRRVEALLRENNITAFSLRRGVDLERVVQLVENQDFAAAASAQIRGTTLIVDYVKALDYLPPDYSEPQDILSRFDAHITRVVARSGTPKVAAGDVVRAGDILIGAYAASSVDETLYPVRADGEVFGKIYFSQSTSFVLEERVVRRTGESVVFTELMIFGVSIFNNDRRPPFEMYQYVRYQTYLARNNILPLIYVTHTYYQLVNDTITRTVDEQISAFTTEVKSQFIMDGASNILDARHTIREIGGIYFLTVFLEVEALLNKV